MKFILFVEGHTEHQAISGFLKRWLDARLKKPVRIDTVRFAGWGDMVGDAPKRAKMYLNAPKGDVIAVIALLDLYRLALAYPADINSAAERVAWATTYLQHEVGEERFRQFFAVHETEAWLFSDPAIFPTEIKNALTDKYPYPEQINSEESPANLLEKLYQTRLKRSYRKTTDGKNLFGKLNPAVACKKCPQLKVLLDTVLELAKSAGH